MGSTRPDGTWCDECLSPAARCRGCAAEADRERLAARAAESTSHVTAQELGRFAELDGQNVALRKELEDFKAQSGALGSRLMYERDAARAECEALRSQLLILSNRAGEYHDERDSARAEVEKMQAVVDAARCMFALRADLAVIAKHGGAGLQLCVDIEKAENACRAALAVLTSRASTEGSK